MRSYLFKSTKEDVIKNGNGEEIKKLYDGLESNGIDPTTLTILESIISGEDYYNIHEKGGYEIIKKIDEDDENSPLFVSSSQNLIDSLKELSIKERREVLEEWCATDEMALYGWTPEKAKHIFDWLISTSSSKKAPDEKIILFIETNPISI